MLISYQFGKVVKYVAHNCARGCIVTENGAIEAFIAGLMRAKKEGLPQNEATLKATAVMLSSMMTWMNANPELNVEHVEKILEGVNIKIFTVFDE